MEQSQIFVTSKQKGNCSEWFYSDKFLFRKVFFLE